MRNLPKALGAKLAANAVTSTLLGFVVIPLLLTPPASAYPIPTSQEEYERYVAEASAQVFVARQNLNLGRQQYLNSVIALDDAQLRLDTTGLAVPTSVQVYEQALNAYNTATEELETAQYNYDNNLIPDPNQPVNERVPGIRADIYNQLPYPNPPRADNLYTFCKTVTFTHINHNWGGGDIEGCGGERVMIHYTGYLTVPETTPYGYDFLNLADDGWYFTLDGVVINDNWTLKGCGGWWSQKFHLEAGRSYQIDAWFYEWGGGACSTLYYDNGYNWGVVPASWYSQNDYAETVYIKDPALLAILEQKQTEYQQASDALAQAESAKVLAQNEYDVAVVAHEQAVQAKTEAESAIPALEQELQLALDILASIQPYVPYIEPEPEPTPTSTEEPQPEPTSTPEPEPTVEPVPPTTEEVLEELWAEATEDDIVVPEELATIPVLGGAIVALADAINFVGNVGADMTPEVREKAEKVVVSAIIVTQVATQAVATATMASASASASSSGSSSSSSTGRRQ